jgi:hypothetical protein
LISLRGAESATLKLGAIDLGFISDSAILAHVS